MFPNSVFDQKWRIQHQGLHWSQMKIQIIQFTTMPTTKRLLCKRIDYPKWLKKMTHFMSRKFSKYFVAWLIKWKQEQNPNNFCNKYFVIIKDCIWLWKRTSWKNWKILRKDRTNSRFTSQPMEQGFYFDLKPISVIFSGPHERKICWIWRHNSYKIETKRIIDNNYNGTIIYDGMCFTWSIYHWLVLSLAGIQVFPHYSLLPNRLETIRPSSTTFGTP